MRGLSTGSTSYLGVSREVEVAAFLLCDFVSLGFEFLSQSVNLRNMGFFFV